MRPSSPPDQSVLVWEMQRRVDNGMSKVPDHRWRDTSLPSRPESVLDLSFCFTLSELAILETQFRIIWQIKTQSFKIAPFCSTPGFVHVLHVVFFQPSWRERPQCTYDLKLCSFLMWKGQVPTPNNWLVVTSNAVPDTVMVSSVEIICSSSCSTQRFFCTSGSKWEGWHGMFWYYSERICFQIFQNFWLLVLTPADLWYLSWLPRYRHPDFLWRWRSGGGFAYSRRLMPISLL